MDIFATLGDGYSTALSGIADRMLPIAWYIAGVFAILTIGLMGIKMATGHPSVWKAGLTSLFVTALYMHTLTQVQPISEAIAHAAVSVGMKASGRSGDAESYLMQPDKIVFEGLGVVANLWDAGYETCKDIPFTGCMGGLSYPMPILIAIGSTLFGYLIAGLGLFSSIFLLKISLFLGMVILPFAIFAPASFFGRGPIRLAVYSGVFIATLTAIVGWTSMAFTAIARNSTGLHEWGASLPFIGTVFVFAGLLFFAHKIASSIAEGGMSLGASFIGAPAGAAATMARGAAAATVMPLASKAASALNSVQIDGGSAHAIKSGVEMSGAWRSSGLGDRSPKLGAQQKQLEAPGWSGKVVRGPRDWKYL